MNSTYEHLKNQRKDFAHKLSANYVKNYAIIVVERLNIQGMARNHHLSRSIYDAAWAQFVSYLSYKAESAGRRLIKVDPKDTTQDCSVCGLKNTVHLDLSVRIFKCPNCKIELDRDYNSSRDVLIKGLDGREPASMLVERRQLHKLKRVETLKREAPCGSLG